MTRFMLVPAALTAPLFGQFFGRRWTTAAIAVVAAIAVGLTLAHSRTKPLESPQGPPWSLTQAEALAHTWQAETGTALVAYERLVPAHACVGAIAAPDEATYLLWGPRLDRRVVYLPVTNAVATANEHTLFYVVVSAGVNRWAAGELAKAGWKITPLGGYWLLAVSPATGAATGACAGS
jgi:hypothetical protein